MSEDIKALAEAHGVSTEAVRVLQEAIRHGGGRAAQFSHPELGGMGQWTAGGMTQVGDMFNTGLRDKVAALCKSLSQAAAAPSSSANSRQGESSGAWWPVGLGQPSATGAQNGMRYACFPQARRVAVEQAGVLTLYDSQDHAITGVGQQQSATQDLVFTSQNGTVRAADLPVAS